MSKPKPRKPQKIEPLFHPPYEAVRGRVHYEAHTGKEFDSNPELSEIEGKDMKKKAGLQRHLLALLQRTRGGHMFYEVQKRINGTQESAVMNDREVEQWYRFVTNAVEDAQMNNPRGYPRFARMTPNLGQLFDALSKGLKFDDHKALRSINPSSYGLDKALERKLSYLIDAISYKIENKNRVEDGLFQITNNNYLTRYAKRVADRYLEASSVDLNEKLKDASNSGEWWSGVSNLLAQWVGQKTGQRIYDVIVVNQHNGFTHNWNGQKITLLQKGDRIDFLIDGKSNGSSRLNDSYTTKKMIKVLQQTYKALN